MSRAYWVAGGGVIGGLARVAAVADHHEAAVPIGRHADFEAHLRQHLAKDAAVGGGLRCLGERLGDSDCDLVVGEAAQVGAAGGGLVLRATEGGGGGGGGGGLAVSRVATGRQRL